MEHAYGSLKIQPQMIKAEVYPQIPHNAFSHALLMLNFLNMDVHEQSAPERF